MKLVLQSHHFIMKIKTKKSKKTQLPAREPKNRIKKGTSKTLGKKLKEIDPELFDYLEQNDKNLLDCEDIDLESGDSDNEEAVPASENERTSDEEHIENENDSEKESDSDSDSTSNEKVHKPPESLEVELFYYLTCLCFSIVHINNSYNGQVASDESDFEDEEAESSQGGKVTISMVNEWEKALKENKYVLILN